MWKATIRSLLGHKVRLLLTAFAITLGVGFVAGTLVLTDTLNYSFDNLFKQVTAGIDVQVQSTDKGDNERAAPKPIPQSLLGAVQHVPGVKSAEGTVFGIAQLVDDKGNAIRNGGAPTFGGGWLKTNGLASLHISQGREPQRDGEVVIDAATAKAHNFKLGSSVRVIATGSVDSFTVVGISKFGTSDGLGGATFASFDLETAQRLLNLPGQFTTIQVIADDGVTASELRPQIEDAITASASASPSNPGTDNTKPPYEAITGKDVAAQQAANVKGFLKIIETALLVFAGIAFFVAAFIIANTFSILVAQRTRELALLRALGASRRQVTKSVLIEASLVGIIASAIGIGFGVGMAIGLEALLKSINSGLPSSPIQFHPRTPIAAILTGVVVTTIAAFVPARRAARVSPVEAMGTDLAGTKIPSLVRRVISGVLVTSAGAALILVGLFGHTGKPAQLVGFGAMLSFLGVTLLSPLAVKPLALLLGIPLTAMFQMSGRLSKQNAARNPRRTAATAAALMIGLGLITTVTVMASSLKASTAKVVDTQVSGDYYIYSQDFDQFTPEVAKRLSVNPAIAQVAELRQGKWKYKGKTQRLSGISPAAVGTILKLEMAKGSRSSLAQGRFLVDEATAKSNNWNVGTVVPVEFPNGTSQQLTLGGIYKRNSIASNILISDSVYAANYTSAMDDFVLVKVAAGSDAKSAARSAIEQTKKDFPNVKVEDQNQFKKAEANRIDRALKLLSALLALAVIIAFIGIVNTLLLSTFERTRELGLLRAVGMSRKQVRRMVRGESVIMAVLGAVLGVGVGILFGVALVRSLNDEGVIVLRIPVTSLVTYVVIAAILGLLAAVWPASRASRLNILAAIATY